MIKKLKRSKGITLIALVITIIVLLILAGVAISMLSGENGILNQTAKGKIESERASTEENIKIATMSALAVGNGKIQGAEALDTLESELKDAGYDVGEITELPITITTNDKEYVIEANGAVKEQEIIELSIENLIKTGEPVTQEKLTLEDDNGHTITIPKNFNLSSESPEFVIEGMIIEDSEDNQYVWIPVIEKTEKYTWGVVYPDTLPDKTADDSEFTSAHIAAIKTALKSYTAFYANNSKYSDVWFGSPSFGKYGYYAENDTAQKNLIYYTNGNMKSDEYYILYNNMLKSVYKNGGFYIGRYEMGKTVVSSTDEAQKASRTASSKEYKSNDVNSSNQKPTIEGMTHPLSKANAIGYNYITQPQAQMLAKKLGENEDYANVETSIMFGLQWDAVCVFLEHFGKVDKSSATNAGESFKSSHLTSSTYCKQWGNYEKASFKLNRGYYTTSYASDTVQWQENYTTAKDTSTSWLCTTGASDQNRALNIYDFAGNLGEWTLEKSSGADVPCVYRGRVFNGSYYASNRNNDKTYYSCCYYSSRTTFCIK